MDSLHARLAREAKLHARKAELDSQAHHAPSEPCGLCGVRADIGCKHRPAVGPPPIAWTNRKEKPDARRSAHAPRWSEDQ